MKRSFWFSAVIANVLTHRIGHYCYLYSTFPIMIFNTIWFVGPLGLIAFPPRANQARFCLQSGRDHHFQLQLFWCRLSCSHMPKQTEPRGKMSQVQKETLRCESTLKCCFFVFVFGSGPKEPSEPNYKCLHTLKLLDILKCLYIQTH